jgi:hypothetical protein
MSAQNGDDTGNPATSPQRRRSFLASRQDDIPEAPMPPVRTEEENPFLNLFPTTKEEEDIPLLTEVIPVENEEFETEGHEAPVFGEAFVEAPPVAPVAPVAPVVSDGNISIEELVTRMTEAIDQQMAYELPTLVEATLLSASEDLRTGITSTMEAALRDFVARYKQQQQLPLDRADTE